MFEALGKLFELNTIDVSGTDVYVIADTTQSYFRRLLARYITVAGIPKVYVTQDQYFGSLFSALLLDESVQGYDFIKEYSVSLEDSNKRTFLSYMTDYLLFNEFPLGILSLMFILPFIALLISVLRQVVGLSVFGVFTPLLFALSMYVLGVNASLLLFVAAGLAVSSIRLVTKKIYLLYSPKISLMVILYCIFALFLWWLHETL